MVQHLGQFMMHLPNGQPYLENGCAGVNGGSIPANGVLTFIPQQQQQQQQRYQHQHQPTTPQSSPRHLPGRQWAGATTNGHGQQRPAVQNQNTGYTSPFQYAQPDLGQQSYSYTNNSPSSYPTAYGNPMQSYHYNIPSNTNNNTAAGYQSAQNIALQAQSQVQGVSGLPQMVQTRKMAAKAQNEVNPNQQRRMQQQAAQQQVSPRQATQQQPTALQAAQHNAVTSPHNNATSRQSQYKVLADNSQTLQHMRPSSNSSQIPSTYNRPSTTTLLPSPKKNDVAQHMTNQPSSPYTHAPRTPSIGRVGQDVQQSPPKSVQRTHSNLTQEQPSVFNQKQRSSFTGKAAPQPDYTSMIDPLEQRTPRTNYQGKRTVMNLASIMNNVQQKKVPSVTTVNGQRNSSVTSPSSASLNGRQQHAVSPIASGLTQRNMLLMSSPSVPMNSRQQQTGSTNLPPPFNMSHMPTLSRQMEPSPSQIQGKKRSATHTPSGNEPAKKKQAIEGHNVQQDPSLHKPQSALDRLLASQATPYRTQFSEQEMTMLSRINKQQEERDIKLRQEQEELEREHQRAINLRLERERLLARKAELKSDPSALYRHYNEYMKHFPAEPGQDRNPYFHRLLANQIMPIDTTTETAIAIAFAKEHWEWYIEYPKDVQRAFKEATRAKELKET